MDIVSDSPLYSSSNIAVIREVYDSELSPHWFSMQLETVLEECCPVIVIEPDQLAEETARWIRIGNYIHKTAVLSGLGSVVAGSIWSNNFIPQVPLCVLSNLCTILYTASWQFDHCVKYQVEKDPKKLEKLPITSGANTARTVVLVRKSDTKRKILHCTVSLAATALCVFRLYRFFK